MHLRGGRPHRDGAAACIDLDALLAACSFLYVIASPLRKFSSARAVATGCVRTATPWQWSGPASVWDRWSSACAALQPYFSMIKCCLRPAKPWTTSLRLERRARPGDAVTAEACRRGARLYTCGDAISICHSAVSPSIERNDKPSRCRPICASPPPGQPDLQQGACKGHALPPAVLNCVRVYLVTVSDPLRCPPLVGNARRAVTTVRIERGRARIVVPVL